jgi:hypothetical protein
MDIILLLLMVGSLVITCSILGYLVYQLQKDSSEWFKKYAQLQNKYFELVIRLDEQSKDK